MKYKKIKVFTKKAYLNRLYSLSQKIKKAVEKKCVCGGCSMLCDPNDGCKRCALLKKEKEKMQNFITYSVISK